VSAIAAFDHAKARRIRSLLRIAVRGVWDTPEGVELKDALSDAANRSRYADRLKDEAKALQLSIRYSKAAEDTGIGKIYKQVYGKPAT
jgi:hypothetical protein